MTAAALSLSLAACGGERTQEQNLEDAASNLANLMPIPTTASTLDRSGLINAAEEAASAYATGTDDGDMQRSMSGRRFAFRMAFGCPGFPLPDAAAPSMRLKMREDGKSYEVRATFSLNAADAGFAKPSASAPATAGPDPSPVVETVEGFWIQRPWLRAEQCPKFPLQPVSPNADGEKETPKADAGGDQQLPVPIEPDRTIGIARFFTSSDSRVGAREGRDYVKIATIAEGKPPPPGIFLVVEGRLRAWPDGKVIECRDALENGKPTGGRPSCIIGTTIDRVAFERADDRAVIAEWSN